MDFSQIAILFSAAAFFGVIAKLLKQPLFIGYIFAGIILSGAGYIKSVDLLEEYSQIGVALLLFLMGLEMNVKDIREAGKQGLITGIFQIVLTFIIGYILSILLNFPPAVSIYLALALTFSSTIIAVRILSDKKDLNSLYGRITIALLLLQDVAAVLILMFLSGSAGANSGGFGVLNTFARGGAVIALVFLLSKKALPFIFEKIASGTSELMFILSIAWALGLSAVLSAFAGLNLETGGFIAGLSLSALPEHLQIAAKTKPLRDFFLTMFFLILGTNIIINRELINLIPAGILFSILNIILHVSVVMFVMGRLGYKNRTSFLVGITGAQVSEFTLKIAAVGLSAGHLDKYYLTLISLIAIMTMTASTYLINSAEILFIKLKDYLLFFEKALTIEFAFKPAKALKNHIVLVGCDRAGGIILKYLIKKKIPSVVIDFNPKVYRELTAKNIAVVFGDVNDGEALESAHAEKAFLIISTISNLSDNLSLVELMKNWSSKPQTIFTSTSKSDGVKLYEKGATYVIVPEMAAGEYIKHLINTYFRSKDKLDLAGKYHFKRMMYV